MPRLGGRVAVVPGAGRGFGREIALALARAGAAVRRRRLAELPLQRFGAVEDVAYCAVVLAADDTGYLTGQILHPSGGWVMG